jgi:hypothetical protein
VRELPESTLRTIRISSFATRHPPGSICVANGIAHIFFFAKNLPRKCESFLFAASSGVRR